MVALPRVRRADSEAEKRTGEQGPALQWSASEDVFAANFGEDPMQDAEYQEIDEKVVVMGRPEVSVKIAWLYQMWRNRDAPREAFQVFG